MRMIEVLQFYVSGFWIWCGLTIGLSIVVGGTYRLVIGSIAAFKGASIRIGDFAHNCPQPPQINKENE
jgi:hypothetical protein